MINEKKYTILNVTVYAHSWVNKKKRPRILYGNNNTKSTIEKRTKSFLARVHDSSTYIEYSYMQPAASALASAAVRGPSTADSAVEDYTIN